MDQTQSARIQVEEVGLWSCLRQAQAIVPRPHCCSSICSETQDVSQLSQAQQKVLSKTQKIIERRSAQPIIIKSLLSAGRTGWWACEHEK